VRRLSWLVCVSLSLVAIAGVAVAASGPWHGLRRVTVTVQSPSLPPPFGKPRTTVFTPGHGLKRAQHALNANHIMRLSKPLTAPPGCAGGFAVTIKIVTHNHSHVKMTGYRCGTSTSGRIGGDIDGFLKAVGITPP